ncbi:MAG: B12-binding domain-containing radical SAM protein [Candidatus Aminicenantes bacterium]|nr:B12-binding domain-containing radical SAM protein [Candidatus Aminicenantes bacterium]
MTNILLIDINDRAGTFGLRSISSCLKREGYRTALVFFCTEFIQDTADVPEVKMAALERVAVGFRPELIGISITSSFGHALASALSERLKKTWDVPIVWGGVHPSLMPEFCLQNANIDYVCVGEGEEAMLELCGRLASGGDAASVPGIMPKQTLKYVRRNPPEHLDELPFQDFSPENKFSILPDGIVVEGEPMVRERFVTRCSRGCHFSCSYCCNASLRRLYDARKYNRMRSVENVIAEIKQYLALNPSCSRIWFSDDSFPFDRSWVESFSRQYREQVGVPFFIWLHPKMVCETNVAALRTAGLKMAMVGIESASATVRKEVFCRPESREDILAADRILTKHKIEKHYDFIVDHPWETRNELGDTFNLLCSLKRPYEVNMHSLILLPNTELAKKAMQEGKIKKGDVIGNIVERPYEASRKFQWSRGIPQQKSIEKSYWLFLISCLGNPAIPLGLIRFLQRKAILKKYPQLLTDLNVNDAGKIERTLLHYRVTLVQKSRLIRHFSNRSVRLKSGAKKVIGFFLGKSQLLFFISGLVVRICKKTPGILLKKRQGSG